MDALKAFLKRHYDQVALFGIAGIIVIYLFAWLISSSPAEAVNDKLALMVEKIDGYNYEPPPLPKKEYNIEISKPFIDVHQPNWTGNPKWAFYRMPYIRFDYFEIQPEIVNAEKPVIESIKNEENMLGALRIRVRNKGTMKVASGDRPGYIAKLTVHRRKKGDTGNGVEVASKKKPEFDELIDILDDNKGEGLEENTEYEYRVRVQAKLNDQPAVPELMGLEFAETSWSPVKTSICFFVERFVMFQKDQGRMFVSFRVWHTKYKQWIRWQSESFMIGGKIKQTKEITIRIDGQPKKIANMDTGYELAEILDNRVEQGRGKKDRGIKCVKKNVEGGVEKTATFWETDLTGTGGGASDPPEKSEPEEEEKKEEEKKEEEKKEDSSEEKTGEEEKKEEKPPKKRW